MEEDFPARRRALRRREHSQIASVVFVMLGAATIWAVGALGSEVDRTQRVVESQGGACGNGVLVFAFLVGALLLAGGVLLIVVLCDD